MYIGNKCTLARNSQISYAYKEYIKRITNKFNSSISKYSYVAYRNTREMLISF